MSKGDRPAPLRPPGQARGTHSALRGFSGAGAPVAAASDPVLGPQLCCAAVVTTPDARAPSAWPGGSGENEVAWPWPPAATLLPKRPAAKLQSRADPPGGRPPGSAVQGGGTPVLAGLGRHPFSEKKKDILVFFQNTHYPAWSRCSVRRKNMGRWWPDEVRVCAEPGACLVLRAAGEEAGGGRRPETLTPSRASGRALWGEGAGRNQLAAQILCVGGTSRSPALTG